MVSVNILWKIDGDDFNFWLINLFGIILVYLVVDDDLVILEVDGKIYKDVIFELLIYYVIGMVIFVVFLLLWIKGMFLVNDSY